MARAQRKSRIQWVTRRYRVPDFDKKEMNLAIKSWVRAQGFSILGQPKFDARKFFWYTGYSIAESKWALAIKMIIAFIVVYRPPVLYVFSTSHLPPKCANIFNEVFAVYANSRGGSWIEETPVAFSSTIFMTSALRKFESLRVDYSLLVRLEPELDRVEAATEEIHVPAGVTVNVRRTRSIKRAVELTQSETNSGTVESGLKFGQLGIITATVQNEIRKQTGRRFEEIETIDYEIGLSGDNSESYTLVWADFMRRGIVEIREGEKTTELPFRCRERTELQVVAASLV